MSYSRWGNSYWYTFWSSNNEKVENFDTALFCICRFMGPDITFSAKKIREKLIRCLDTVRIEEPDASEEEIEELAGYMTRFLKDVDKEFKK